MDDNSLKKYQRPPSPFELAIAFADECKTLLPKVLKQKRELLKYYNQLEVEPFLVGIPDKGRELVRMFVVAMSPSYEIMAKLTKDIKRLKALVALTKKGASRLNVARAKEYSLKNLCTSEGIELRRSGSRYVGLCPFHPERRPSFTVFNDNHYRCFGCGESGDTIDFLMKLRRMLFWDAVKYLGG